MQDQKLVACGHFDGADGDAAREDLAGAGALWERLLIGRCQPQPDVITLIAHHEFGAEQRGSALTEVFDVGAVGHVERPHVAEGRSVGQQPEQR
ncbi:hypothetical protein QV65_01760 [Rhodococcus erythropolis]|nr:hypothetical protein QV65_01760 [Rhodococcus erythropolis]